MPEIKKLNLSKIMAVAVLLISLADSYVLLKHEHFSQLLWFCNSVLYLLAIGLYFENSVMLTGIFIGAMIVQIPWVLDFLVEMFFGYSLFGIASYMFDYGFNNIRFYLELDHLLIIPLSIYGIKKTKFHKNGWVFASIIAFAINTGAYMFSSRTDNVNCVFYSCFSDKIIINVYPLAYMLGWTFLLYVLFYILNRIICKTSSRKSK